MSNSFATIILAAGRGKRMQSDRPKVLHRLAGRPLVHYVIEQARSVGSRQIILVIGHKRELVIEASAGMGVEYAVQEKQLGTGDAVQACRGALREFGGDVLILSGDVPLLRAATIQAASDLHRQRDAAATVFTFIPLAAAGYGRIIRGDEGELLRIVEHKDATTEERKTLEVNAGIYFFKALEMFRALDEIGNDNAAGEFYLTDTIAVLACWGRRLAAFLVADPMEVEGVNNPEQLLTLEREWLRRQPVDKSVAMC